MPPKEYEKGQPFFIIGGERWESLVPLGDDGIEMIETSDLEEYLSYSPSENRELEMTFDMDKETARKFHAMLLPKHGDKLTLETSCICDGTLAFGVHLMQKLAKMGATNIKLRSEEVENPNPAWMKTRFIATGIIWNTNNFRKLHGIPMRRRYKCTKLTGHI